MNVDLIKDICDGASINNEVMYGTTEKINIKCKIIATSNYTPKFKNDNGIKRRYKQLQFNSQFVDKAHEQRCYGKTCAPDILAEQQQRAGSPSSPLRRCPQPAKLHVSTAAVLASQGRARDGA